MRSFRSKVKSPRTLKNLLKNVRAKSKNKRLRVVFTNGCFDLLHVGHISYLERARKKGELLVVAIDTDESVRSLKGPTRPINTLADRMSVLAGLECVDFVTHFSDSNPVPLILELQPDILVKGGDWKPQEILGYREVKSWGGRVLSLPYIDGKSTTRMIEKAQKK